MTWKLLSVKVPPAMLTSIKRQSGGNVPKFVRETLAARLGLEYREQAPGLAGATPSVRKRVSRAGVMGRGTK
jgi:hypothetical protein